MTDKTGVLKYCLIKKEEVASYRGEKGKKKQVCPAIRQENIFDDEEAAKENCSSDQAIIVIEKEEIDDIGDVRFIKGWVKKIIQK